jgi:hypothetical protein
MGASHGCGCWSSVKVVGGRRKAETYPQMAQIFADKIDKNLRQPASSADSQMPWFVKDMIPFIGCIRLTIEKDVLWLQHELPTPS